MQDEAWGELEPKELAKQILRRYRKIAVVGISADPLRASNGVSRYMLRNGYEIVPVNPNLDAFEGIPTYADLDAVPDDVEVLNIFRRPEFVPELVDAAIRKGVKAIWMQQGIIHEEAAAKARAANIAVVMDRCIMQDHLANRWDAD